MRRLNCWELKKCGREPGGQHQELGVCPAAIEKRLDGVHQGANAGRACWVVAGTFCDQQVQGSFAKKYATCEKCDFYSAVEREEEHNFKLALYLLGKLKEPAPEG
jgi:hypothetical protein